MEQGDWQNDADYPRAPLPAHERSWRHPSEVGAEHWVQSEPPLVVGRGLSVATGTVGAVLALGLLWLMVPHPRGGSDVAVESSTTSARTAIVATAAPTTRDTVTTMSGVDVSTGSPITIDRIDGPTSTTGGSPATSASPSLTASPMPTMLLDSGSTTTEQLPVAVALVPGHYLVTTAAAVRGREGFAVMLPSGQSVVGAVVSVDPSSGTAVLSVGADVDDAMIPASTADITSGTVVVMAPEATTARLWVDDSGTQIGYHGDMGSSEGSIVLDDDGRLVGLCTRSARGMQLVAVADLLDALTAATTMRTPAWLGVDSGFDAAGNVVVTRVLDGGPGHAAGIRVGDVITAIDGVPVADPETLRSVIGTHSAGESVTLTVVRASAPQTSTTSTATTATTATIATTAPAASSVPTTSLVSSSVSLSSPTSPSSSPSPSSPPSVSAPSSSIAATTTSTPTTVAATATNLTATGTVDITVTLAPAPER